MLGNSEDNDYHPLHYSFVLFNIYICCFSAKINAARAFILNIALVAQNKDKFPYLDSRSFSKLHVIAWRPGVSLLTVVVTGLMPGQSGIDPSQLAVGLFLTTSLTLI